MQIANAVCEFNKNDSFASTWSGRFFLSADKRRIRCIRCCRRRHQTLYMIMLIITEFSFRLLVRNSYVGCDQPKSKLCTCPQKKINLTTFQKDGRKYVVGLNEPKKCFRFAYMMTTTTMMMIIMHENNDHVNYSCSRIEVRHQYVWRSWSMDSKRRTWHKKDDSIFVFVRRNSWCCRFITKLRKLINALRQQQFAAYTATETKR